MNLERLSLQDPEIARSIKEELVRIESTINLIASENYTSMRVMEATGSVMTNKYAEGYPGHRYYGGCQWVDVVEELARERLLELFGLDKTEFHANVQPHSGAQANMAAYLALIKPGDVILGMNLAAGGHLTHGYKINASGVFYTPVNYGLHPETETLDYEEIAYLARKHKPALIIAGASAYSRIIDFERFRKIADEVGAKLLVDMAHIAGPIAAGLHPSPFAYADVVTSTTHKTLRGPRGGLIICKQEYARAIDRAVMPGIQGGPLMHHIAAKAVAFKEALHESFREYQRQVLKNARVLCQKLIEKGYRIVSETTDNHLLVVDLRSKNVTGKAAETALIEAGICVNKNCIPGDPQSPFITSGIRLGTPALTTRGFKEADITEVACLIDRAIVHHEDKVELKKVRIEVQELCSKFPVYQKLEAQKSIIPAKTEQFEQL